MNLNDSDKNKGLYNKFIVTCTDGASEEGGRHHGCQYFVLDLNHDPGAKPALLAYVEWARENGYEALADDLDLMLNRMFAGTVRPLEGDSQP